MNRWIIKGIYLLLAVALFSQDKLTLDQQELTNKILGQFYNQQNMIHSEKGLLQDILMTQLITDVDGYKRSTTTSYLFAKDINTFLIFLRDEKNNEFAYLKKGNDTWIYKMNLRLPMKISLSQNIYGEANLGDIIGINLQDDFNLLSPYEESNSNVLPFTRKNLSYPYPNIEVVADKESLDISKIRYMGAGGNILREALIESYKEIEGERRVPTWKIINIHMNVNKYTNIEYINVEEITLPHSFFQPNANALKQFLIWCRGL